MCVLFACTYVYCVHAWCMWKPKKGIGFLGIEVKDGCEFPYKCKKLNPELHPDQ